MAYESEMIKLSWPAVADLSTFQFQPLTLITNSTFPDGCVTTISTTATKPVGILQDTPDAAGVMASVCVSGISKVRCYTGAVAVLDSIGVNASGLGAVTTTDNQWVVGDVLEKADDTNENTMLTVNVNIHRY